MKKNFYKAVFILLIGSGVTKFLSMFIRILMSRYLGPTGMGYYMLVMPTFGLFIVLAHAGLPSAIAAVLAKRDDDSLIYFLFLSYILIKCSFLCFCFFASTYIATYLCD